MKLGLIFKSILLLMTEKITMKKMILILPFTALLASCGATSSKKLVQLDVSYVPTNTIPMSDMNKKVQSDLLQVANSVDAEMNRLVDLKMQDHGITPFKFNETPQDLNRRINLNWNGPMMQVIKKIAIISKYDILPEGKPPATPIIVDVHMTNQMLINILRNIQYQTANNCRISFRDNPKTIVINYINT
jgi:hypothetical protein